MGKNDKEEMMLMDALSDFTSKENWDKFFRVRDANKPFEWYADWSCLRDPLLSLLESLSTNATISSASTSSITGTSSITSLNTSSDTSSSVDGNDHQPSPLQILIPGCGNSKLSEHLYDAGFRRLTNIDFSKVIISDMLRLHVRSRPDMRWRVMDMTNLQFADESFDAIIDKGGLDALMEPEHGPKLGSLYLSEVKRVLKHGGEFVCLTLAESHVLELLFSTFRYGWKTNIDKVSQKPSNTPSFQTFMVVVGKESSSSLNPITASFSHSSLDCSGNQGRGLFQALESENKLRQECSDGANILSSINDLKLGNMVPIKELVPGRRVQLLLGDKGESCFSYKAILLDSRQQSGQFIYHCGVFLVPKTRAHEWLFSSADGQWVIVESSKAARLIMVFLDSVHMRTSMEDIQKDLSPLVKRLGPEEHSNGAQIPFMVANDGVKQRNIVQKVKSPVTGEIIVEDVIYENDDDHSSNYFPPKDSIFRRLTFERSLGLVQSEALLLKENPKGFRESDKKKIISSKSKRESQRRANSRATDESRCIMKADHSFLASSYHSGIVSGFALVASDLENAVSSARTVKAIIIGLGAGLLPMFLHRSMPFLDVEVVELDPLILDLAKNHFGFTEKLKVHVTDGIQFITNIANDIKSSKVTCKDEESGGSSQESPPSINGSDKAIAVGRMLTKIDVLIIDADSSDLSTGLTCPPSDFTEESFLLSVKESLSENGLFVINLVSRLTAIREMVASRMKAVFSQLFYLELEEDVNKVLFALPTEVCVAEDSLSEAAARLQKLLKFSCPERGLKIIEAAKKIKKL